MSTNSRAWRRMRRKIGYRISVLKKRSGLTHKEFGEKWGGATDRTSMRWVTGRSLPSLCVLLSMCRTYNVKPDWMFAT